VQSVLVEWSRGEDADLYSVDLGAVGDAFRGVPDHDLDALLRCRSTGLGRPPHGHAGLTSAGHVAQGAQACPVTWVSVARIAEAAGEDQGCRGAPQLDLVDPGDRLHLGREGQLVGVLGIRRERQEDTAERVRPEGAEDLAIDRQLVGLPCGQQVRRQHELLGAVVVDHPEDVAPGVRAVLGAQLGGVHVHRYRRQWRLAGIAEAAFVDQRAVV